MNIQIAASGAPKPDNHLTLCVNKLSGKGSTLVRVLLRVDLGARIHVNEPEGKVHIEGRFWKADVINAIKGLGCDVISVDEVPRCVAQLGSTVPSVG